MPNSPAPVLILGAGVNGLCVARELVLNRVPVWIIDINDIAFGATAKSSRLIHGGLRYLEYGDFHLVSESLHERDRLLQLAPQFVTPLRLHIPVRRRLGGFIAAGLRFLGLSRTQFGKWIGSGGGRGLITVRFGLWLYDLLARSKAVPRHRVYHTGQGGPQFPLDQFPWSCAYFDAQMERPERFCIALANEMQELTQHQGTDFRLLTYHRAALTPDGIKITPCSDSAPRPLAPAPLHLTPSLIVNATGAWGDWTLQELPTDAPPLFGGTKGTHIFTRHAGLTEALGADAVYAEAHDGRLVFLIPVEFGVMVGTTDDRFDQRPEEARSNETEVAYLLQLANEIFPQVGLTESDIFATCSGVRPLPYSDGSKTATISRGHSVDERTVHGIPLLTLIGGKLTTCRALGEEVGDRVLSHLGISRTESTRERIVPGGEHYPASGHAVEAAIRSLATASGESFNTCRTVWRLLGTKSVAFFSENGRPASEKGATVVSTALPQDFVRGIIASEWVTNLEDLVERRLLLALEPTLTRETLVSLAELLHAIRPGQLSVDEMVERASHRLRTFYARRDI
jgi:glycerol-3-phosphate dehydrogenase